MNIITHNAEHTESNCTAFHKELPYISEEKALISAYIYHVCIGHQVITSQQVVHIRCFPLSGSQIMKYHLGLAGRLTSASFLATQAVKM